MKKAYLVDYSKCTYNSCGRPCIKDCPVNITNRKFKGKKKVFPAIDFKRSTNEVIIHTEHCIKCGICVNRCPRDAIFVKNYVEEDPSQFKVHHYNSGFRLYQLPTLTKGKITGLVGPNGIGKSTIMNVLSKTLKPNFGNAKSTQDWEKISQNIKDNNIRNHFAKDSNISYKKQVLRILFEKYKGQTVSEILSPKKSHPQFKQIITALDIQSIQDRLLAQCSGGELQRFSIAKVLLTDANVILIDEPCTFLDVKKRIDLAEALQDLKEEDKAFLVVDHDLAILDYMSDMVHLFYGEPSKFGIISRILNVKNGINTYLNGFIASDNIEFRENKIRFRKTVSGRTWANARIFAEWPELTKSFDSFRLDIGSGTLYENEVLGVVGQNGLGKTTFFKILVGQLKPDVENWDLYERYSISYKPQYITAEFKGTVREFISSYSRKYIHNEHLIQELYQPLGVDAIFDNHISELSGGQLQRTFIAACLTKDANLYLIDEPSAYLDVEERLKIAEIIRSHTKRTDSTTIAIEHDIQIIDSLADRLLIFLGQPGVKGYTLGPLTKQEGMNSFLKSLDITFRRDAETGRARINKKDSKKDVRQRLNNEYYYIRMKNQ
ncbi:MAG: ribosome biogenesis/translation initiation ATPase RLI [Promethearchaeota archaeon]